ncbi:MAG: alanine--tRNA ligase [Bacilli bacterium]|nr:alanine--tRNA ligase [Bacilli bacterium]
MEKLTGNEMRDLWFQFWESKGHQVLESASLVPINDPTLLWINAGVTPLKKYFDGSIVPDNRRICSSQKCIRTNDIENVGKTARHQTFFEMLGNFSIGDYFKEEAITWAFEFLTSPEWIGFDKEKLYMTIYPNDEVAYNTWIKVGVDPSHIIKLEGNFWEIGPGPSGPDSEIFYDRGEKYDPENLGIKLLQDDIENDRYIEIWNNVFSQYNAKAGIPREEYPELPSKNIDTGMGLERMLSILQEVDTNFDTDLFLPIIEKTEEISGKKYNGEMAFKVIADHIRTITFALSDGANFGNNGRNYVLRRLLRRAVRYGKVLGIERPFLKELVPVVVSIMEYAYPNLRSHELSVMEKINKEEELFMKTLAKGEKRLQELFETSTDKTISGEEAFKLYDTYGFPFELTLEYAEEKGFTVSKEAFDTCMKIQKDLARESRSKATSMNIQNEELLNFKEESLFVGYDTLKIETTILRLFNGEKFVETLENSGYIVLEETPFYAESGGQISDIGTIIDGNIMIEVEDSFKGPNKQHFHYVTFDGVLKVGDKVIASVNEEFRHHVMCNHSAAHVLQRTLQEVLGESVHQAGSAIDNENVRFDIHYEGKISKDELIKVEERVNERIATKVDTKTEILTLEEAKQTGAMALFDEKYGDKVRVVTIGDSKELCAGTHVKNIGEIERFAIVSLESKGSNVYRIVGATGDRIESSLFAAIKPYNDEMMKLLSKAKRIIEEGRQEEIILEFNFNINNDAPHTYKDIVFNLNEMETIKKSVMELEKRYLEEKSKKALQNLDVFVKQKEKIGNIETIIVKVENYDLNILKQVIDALLNSLNNGFIFIATVNNGNVNILAKAHADLKDKIHCGNMVKEAALKSNGSGGGSPIFAQGGGKDASALDEILKTIKKQIEELAK